MRTFATCDTCRAELVEVIDGRIAEHTRAGVTGRERCPASGSRTSEPLTAAEAHEVVTRQYKAWEAKFRKAHGVEHLGPEALEAFARALEGMLAQQQAEVFRQLGAVGLQLHPAPPEGKGDVIDIEPVKE